MASVAQIFINRTSLANSAGLAGNKPRITNLARRLTFQELVPRPLRFLTKTLSPKIRLAFVLRFWTSSVDTRCSGAWLSLEGEWSHSFTQNVKHSDAQPRCP